ncbi:MAG: hypothetical protein VX026_03095, partial [Myxococcota bacterium]|nr:hypothetical protein [Myxococcota bacterium]
VKRILRRSSDQSVSNSANQSPQSYQAPKAAQPKADNVKTAPSAAPKPVAEASKPKTNQKDEQVKAKAPAPPKKAVKKRAPTAKASQAEESKPKTKAKPKAKAKPKSTKAKTKAKAKPKSTKAKSAAEAKTKAEADAKAKAEADAKPLKMRVIRLIVVQPSPSQLQALSQVNVHLVVTLHTTIGYEMVKILSVVHVTNRMLKTHYHMESCNAYI